MGEIRHISQAQKDASHKTFSVPAQAGTIGHENILKAPYSPYRACWPILYCKKLQGGIARGVWSDSLNKINTGNRQDVS